MTITAVLCDLYGVIAKVQSASAQRELVELAGATSDPAQFWNAYLAERDDYDGDRVSSRDYWQAVGTRMGVHFDDQQIDALNAADLRSWSAMDADVVAVLPRIAEKYPLALLSNAPLPLVEWLRASQPWLDIFKFCCFSAETHHVKPKAGAYTEALARFNVDASQILFVDDREANCAAASTVGLHTHLFTDLQRLLTELDVI